MDPQKKVPVNQITLTVLRGQNVHAFFLAGEVLRLREALATHPDPAQRILSHFEREDLLSIQVGADLAESEFCSTPIEDQHTNTAALRRLRGFYRHLEQRCAAKVARDAIDAAKRGA